MNTQKVEAIKVTFASVMSTMLLFCIAPDVSVGQQAIPLDNLDAFVDPAQNWSIAKDAFGATDHKHDMTLVEGKGVLLNKPSERQRENLFTKLEHGDIDLEIEVLVPHRSNSGIYFQSRYEVQILDSWRTQNPTFSDMGGIYERWDESRGKGYEGFGGIPPMMNVAKAPGLWQKLEIKFRAPRFDDQGNKTSNAMFKEVKLNGVVIHVNAEVSGPTRAAADESSEVALAPLMIQGDHGPVAFRNITYKLYSGDQASLKDVSYMFGSGSFSDYSILEDGKAITTGSSPLFVDQVGQDRLPYLAEYQGTLEVPKTGTYNFELYVSWFQGDPHFKDKDIGDAILTIGESDPIIFHKGPDQLDQGSIELEAGSHHLVLKTRKNRRTYNLVTLSIEGPGIEKQILNDPSSLPPVSRNAPIILSDGSRPIVQHGFMNHADEKKTHVMTVGGFNGVNFSVNLENGSLLHVWTGDFIDAGPMWQGRGNTQLMLPSASAIELQEVPLIDLVEDLELKYLGYELDSTGLPQLKYDSSSGLITQSFMYPENGGLRRRVEIDKVSIDIQMSVLRAGSVDAFSKGHYRSGDGKLLVRVNEGMGSIEVQNGTLLAILERDGDKSFFEYDLVW